MSSTNPSHSEREIIQSMIHEAYSTVGISQIAASIAEMLQEYIDTNGESATLAGAQELLDKLKSACESARSNITELLGSDSPEDLAEKAIHTLLGKLRARFRDSFSAQGAEKAMNDMIKWVDALKRDLYLDARKLG